MADTPAPVSMIPKRETRRAFGRNFGVSTFKHNRWSYDLDADQTIEDALEPGFWSEQSAQLAGHDQNAPRGVGDIIEIRKADTGQYVETIVEEVGKGYLRLRLIARSEPVAVTLPDDLPLTTRWNVGKRGHEVIRKSDSFLMAGPFQTKAAAVKWIVDHLKAMAA